MKQSKSSIAVLGLCLALFAVGCYLKLSNQSEKIKTERRIKAATSSAAGSTAQGIIPVASPAPIGEASPASSASAAASPTPESAAPGETDVRDASVGGSSAATAATGLRGISPQQDDLVAFKKIIVDVKKSVPTIDQLRSLSEADIHETPIEIQNAAIEMGRLSEAFEKHPELSGEAVQFYEACALDKKYPSSVRASCYLDLARQYKKQGKSMDDFSGDSQVPKRIKDLSKSLL